jgi:hypothetical protein
MFATNNLYVTGAYMGTFLFSRGDLPETDSAQYYNFTLRATNVTDQSFTDILILAQLPPPIRTSRYTLSATDLTAPLATQRARTADKWFVDNFPPQGFYNNGSVFGKNDVSR